MMTEDQGVAWTRGDPVGYIREEIPEFDVPRYEGDHYEALVPDTLDLQERAALAVNVLTEVTDPAADYEIYFDAVFRSNPPIMRHNYSDSCQPKFMEALPLMRIASGSDLNKQVDRRWMEVALHQLGPDGLSYSPTVGRPWTLAQTYEFVPDSAVAGMKQQIIPFSCGRLLSALTLYHLRDGSGVWQQAAERLVDGLVELAVDRDRYAYFAPSSHWAEKGITYDYGRGYPLMGSHVGFCALGLAHLYRETGYGPAIELAGKLLRYVTEEIHYFDRDGRFGADRPSQSQTRYHFHMHTYCLLAMLEYGLATGDEYWFDLVRKGFQYGMSEGNTLLGYFPEFPGTNAPQTSEICEVADMIALGLKLSEAGIADHWDDVDRWIRNMFAEGQLQSADWVYRMVSDWPRTTTEGMYYTSERAVERNLGGFAGWPTANDWYDPRHWYGGWGIMHCCTGNGTRAIYYIWQHILSHSDGRLKVNLLLNRASPWADVDSHIPYVGQVDVKIKRPLDLSIRIPEWTKPGDVRVRVNGADRELGWDGRYAVVGDVVPGDVASMSFPIAERTDTVWIEKQQYTLVRKGNDVVAIDPPGRYCPLYQREHYRQNGTGWRKIQRFVSGEQILW